MIARGHTSTALVIDALYAVGSVPGEALRMKEAQTLLSGLYGMSRHTVRVGLQNPVFRRYKAKSEGGRCAYVYTLPHPHQVERWFLVLDDLGVSDVLPSQAYKSPSAYKMYLHGAYIRRLTHKNNAKFKHSRAKMAQRLQVCARTLRRYEKRLGVNVTQNITISELKRGVGWNLPAEKNNDRSQWLVVTYPDGTQRNFPAVRAIAARAEELNWKVCKVRQRMNSYEFWRFADDKPDLAYTDTFTRTDDRYNPQRKLE